MENILNCPLCNDYFNNSNKIPHIFLCGHTFCSSCICQLIIKSKSMKEVYIKCPFDNNIGSQFFDTQKIPINKIVIDLIESNGQNLYSLNLKSNTYNGNFLPCTYLDSAENNLVQVKKNSILQYDIIKNSLNNIYNEKNLNCNNIINYFNSIIEIFSNEKEENLKLIENYYKIKIEEYSNAMEYLTNKRNFIENALQKINLLKTQNLKPTTISEQLTLLNELHLEKLNQEKFDSAINSIINIINEGKNKINLFLNNNYMFLIEQLKNCFQINISEEILENKKEVLSDYSLNNLINSINDINSNLSNLTLNETFIWFQPLGSGIYKFNSQRKKWIKINENKENFLFNEMFRQTKLNNNNYLITGGIINYQSSKNIFFFSEKQCSIEKKKDMINGRRAHSTIYLNNKVYIFGGVDSSGNPMNECEYYNILSNECTSVKNMNEKKCRISLVEINNKFIFSFGGDTNNNISENIEKYDIENNNWILLKIILPLPMTCIGIVKLSDKEILLCGGYSSQKGQLNSIYKFDVDDFSILELDKKLRNPGYTIYDCFINMNIIHLFFGGDNIFAPSYQEFVL